jgi:putative ABC transport system ATP-binding protein
VPDLIVDDVHVTFGTGLQAMRALAGVSLTLDRGGLALLMGPSGSGKTTLLSVMGGILPPDAGRVLIDGTEVAGLAEAERAAVRRQKIGFVFQAFRLMSALTAEENVAVALSIRGMATRQALARARACLEDVGLSSKCRVRADRLSGGEKQRVAVARALVGDAPILLADEPTASLDSLNGLAIATLLKEVAKQKQRVVVVVSHDERLVPFADRVLHLRDGRLLT